MKKILAVRAAFRSLGLFRGEIPFVQKNSQPHAGESTILCVIGGKKLHPREEDAGAADPGICAIGAWSVDYPSQGL